MNVKFWNYGNYSSDNYGSHSTAFSDTEGNTFWFSYNTLVAFKTKGHRYVCQNCWGTVTGKHLNWIDDGDKASRIPHSEFNRKYKECFDTKNNKTA